MLWWKDKCIFQSGNGIHVRRLPRSIIRIKEQIAYWIINTLYRVYHESSTQIKNTQTSKVNYR